MINLAKIETDAAALKARNIAKHKAQGKTHRLEIHIFNHSGLLTEVKVFYTAIQPTIQGVVELAHKYGSKSISKSLEFSNVEKI